MKSEPKVKRRYQSSIRAAQAGTTRHALLDAAAGLFSERGYVMTSIDEIAREAGVARATVFTSVGGKPSLLKAAYDRAIVGDDLPVSLAERPRSRQVRAEPDARRYLALYAEIATEVAARVATINEVIREASGADAEARELYDRVQRERLVGAQHIVGDVESKGGLRPGLSRDDAVDIVWLLIEPSVYVRLVKQRGWSPRRYSDWLAETLQRQLLK